MFFTPLGLAVMLIKHQQVRRTVRLFTLSSVQVPILLPDGLEFNTLYVHFVQEITLVYLSSFPALFSVNKLWFSHVRQRQCHHTPLPSREDQWEQGDSTLGQLS